MKSSELLLFDLAGEIQLGHSVICGTYKLSSLIVYTWFKVLLSGFGDLSA